MIRLTAQKWLLMEQVWMLVDVFGVFAKHKLGKELVTN
jgi:hypothetical protein